jgi:D-tyrosyl-tRNA(Tyr) deacylase
VRALVQRVHRARVSVAGESLGEIGEGLLILVGFKSGDGESELLWMAKKCAQLRVFADSEGKMNRSLLDTGGGALVVSQFTLYGDADKGNRPSYIEAARPEIAEPLYEAFCRRMSEALGRPVATGRFAAEMDVELTNAGPVTIWIAREPALR